MGLCCLRKQVSQAGLTLRVIPGQRFFPLGFQEAAITQGSELFLGLPHVRLAPELCLAQGLGKCSDPSGTAPAPVPTQSEQESSALARRTAVGESSLQSKPCSRGTQPPHPREDGISRQDYTALTTGEGWGALLRAAMGLVHALGTLDATCRAAFEGRES